MDQFAPRTIVLAVFDACSCRNALHVARFHHGHVPHAVFVSERAADNVTNDFHIAMRVHIETSASPHAVLVNHPQTAKTYLLRVVVVRERKRVVTVKPTVIGVAAFTGKSSCNQIVNLYRIPDFFVKKRLKEESISRRGGQVQGMLGQPRRYARTPGNGPRSRPLPLPA